MQHPAEYSVYIGTYAPATEPALFLYTLNMQTYTLTYKEGYAGITNPSFLALDRQHGYLYAVSEIGTTPAEKDGAVASFRIAPQTGSLTPINQQPTHGSAPCYLSLTHDGRALLVINYFSGNVNFFPLGSDGTIAPLTDNIQHHGHGTQPERQDGPHTHSVVVSPEGQYAFVADLGLDQLFTYKIDMAQQKLLSAGITPVSPATGPRHLRFNAAGTHAYLINELASTIITFAFDPLHATFQQLQVISTLPGAFTGTNTAAEIQISPSGRFLYASNRGDDSIVVFAIDPSTALLTYVEHVSSQGKTPRFFTLDPTGTLLLVANQDSATIVTYLVDQTTGRLQPTGQSLAISHPVYLEVVNS